MPPKLHNQRPIVTAYYTVSDKTISSRRPGFLGEEGVAQLGQTPTVVRIHTTGYR